MLFRIWFVKRISPSRFKIVIIQLVCIGFHDE